MMPALTTNQVAGELRENEPMSRHTSWRVGGPAELFFRPASVDDLSQFLAGLEPDVPVFWFGLGSFGAVPLPPHQHRKPPRRLPLNRRVARMWKTRRPPRR